MALTPTEREEHFFKAMVDAADGNTPEELEPTERREHWYKEIIDAIKAGGGGVLVVHAIPSVNTMTLDKTWQEIHDADAVSVVFDRPADNIRDFLFCSSAFERAPLGGGDTEYVVKVNDLDSSQIILFIASSASGYPSYTVE